MTDTRKAAPPIHADKVADAYVRDVATSTSNHAKDSWRQKELDFFKKVSLYDILMINEFYDRFLSSADMEGGRNTVSSNPKIGDIAALFKVSHSTFRKQLKSLEDNVELTFSEKLYGAGIVRELEPTHFGETFISITKKIERDFRILSAWMDGASNRLDLRVAVNSFSYHAFRSIEEQFLHNPEFHGYRRRFEHMRSTMIFDKVKHTPSIDVGITESFADLETGRQLEVIKLSEHKISLISNYKVDQKYFTSENVISRASLVRLPIVVGNSRSFLEYLCRLTYDESVLEDSTLALSMVELEDLVRDRFNIKEISSSVTMIADELLTGKDSFVMLATPEVREYVAALSEAESYGAYFSRRKKALYFYEVDDFPLTLKKYAIRRKLMPHVRRKEIAEQFWKACEEIGRKQG